MHQIIEAIIAEVRTIFPVVYRTYREEDVIQTLKVCEPLRYDFNPDYTVCWLSINLIDKNILVYNTGSPLLRWTFKGSGHNYYSLLNETEILFDDLRNAKRILTS